MNDKITAHYENLFALHGYSPNAVQWRDEKSQSARFRVLMEISHDLDSVLDVGAGLAHLYTYLREHGFQGRYLGLEFVQQFVDFANRLMKDDKNAEVLHFDISSDELPTGFDYGFISGVFNNARDNAEEFMYDTLTRLWNVCEKGMAFNILSTHVDYFDSRLFYTNPENLFTFLKRELQGHIVMYHDYITYQDGFPCEVTYVVRKEPRIVAET